MAARTAARRNKAKFWKFKNSADGGAELYLYGKISSETWYEDDVTPKSFLRDLQGIGNAAELTVRINSGGGDVFAAQTIGNMLEHCGAHTTCRIDGLCASAATIIACHCNKVVAGIDATYMIHPPTVGAFDFYEEEELRALADAVHTVRENILTVYEKKTARPREELADEMKMTSWWTAQAAKEAGFIDEIDEEAEAPVLENRAGVLFMNSVDTGIAAEEAAKHFAKSRLEKSGFLNTQDRPEATEPTHNEEESSMSEPKAGATPAIQTMDELRAAYPELVKQIEDKAAGNERERIREIEDMTMPGGEDMANEAKFTKPMNAADFACALVKAAKKAGRNYMNDAREDAQRGGAAGARQQSEPAGAAAKDDEDAAFMNSLKKASEK